MPRSTSDSGKWYWPTVWIICLSQARFVCCGAAQVAKIDFSKGIFALKTRGAGTSGEEKFSPRNPRVGCAQLPQAHHPGHRHHPQWRGTPGVVRVFGWPWQLPQPTCPACGRQGRGHRAFPWAQCGAGYTRGEHRSLCAPHRPVMQPGREDEEKEEEEEEEEEGGGRRHTLATGRPPGSLLCQQACHWHRPSPSPPRSAAAGLRDGAASTCSGQGEHGQSPAPQHRAAGPSRAEPSRERR